MQRCWEKKNRASVIYRALDGGIQMTITPLKSLTVALCLSRCERWDFYVLLLQNTRNLCWNCFVLGPMYESAFFLSIFVHISQRPLLFCIIGKLTQCCSNVKYISNLSFYCFLYVSSLTYSIKDTVCICRNVEISFSTSRFWVHGIIFRLIKQLHSIFFSALCIRF